jgi:choloylglycine hydrolase
MCTAISDVGIYHFFARTLDVEESFGARVVIMPRAFKLEFIYEGVLKDHLFMIGAARISDGMPLFFDGVNEAGLCAAALSFPESVYLKRSESGKSLASFEVIPYVLSSCRSVDEARRVLSSVTVTDDSFGLGLPATPLHWLFADRRGAICVEQGADGVKIYDNPIGVLTNSPPFPYHTQRLRELLHLSPAMPKNTLLPTKKLEPFSSGSAAFGLPGDWSSSSRFIRAAYVKEHTERKPERDGDISRIFHIMRSVSVPLGVSYSASGKPTFTEYTACINAELGEYYFNTYSSGRIRAVRVADASVDSSELISFSMEEDEA